MLTSIAEGEPDVVYGPNFNPVCALTYVTGPRTSWPEWARRSSVRTAASSRRSWRPPETPTGDYFASSPDVTVFQDGEFYANEYLPAYEEQFGTEPTAVFNAHAFDARTCCSTRSRPWRWTTGAGNLTISRTALKDAVLATSGYEGMTGIITCTPLGDCATDVTIGIFRYPNWPVEGGEEPADAVYSDTKSLDEVI